MIDFSPWPFKISIHSLRMEGDRSKSSLILKSRTISIHSLRMEGDQSEILFKIVQEIFQSTPSAWRET